MSNGAVQEFSPRGAAAAVSESSLVLSRELKRAVRHIARTPTLLVACDYDGTMAPITEDFATALPTPASADALRALAHLPKTDAAVISGRALRDLATLSRLPAEIQLIGSHGSEPGFTSANALPSEARTLLAKIQDEVESLAKDLPGVHVEVKPTGVALHLRGADAATTEWIRTRIRRGPAGYPSVYLAEENALVELSVVRIDKGQALDEVRRAVSATGTLFVGDSETDESAFARLTEYDVAVKVGTGQTGARFKIDGPALVPALLTYLAEERRAWLFGKASPPIERLTMLASRRSVALLTPDARVTWFCHPEPDSAAIFADLLGGPAAGHFSIAPVRPGLPLGQRYVPGTMTVQTRWSRLLVTDYLDQDPGPFRTDLIRVLTGSGPARIEFAPRPEFGAVPVRLLRSPDGLLAQGTAEPMVLRSPGIEWHIESDEAHDTAVAIVELRSGEPVELELRCGTEDLSPHELSEPKRRQLTEKSWSDWLSMLTLPSVKRGFVARSALTLKGLCHETTGAIMAAATTSLPEEIGGVRNWDYRYCWLRDAALTAQALVSLGSVNEADAYLRWVDRILGTVADPGRLHPLYSLGGQVLGSEAEIHTLPGYAGSRPVRVGNLANQQVQLDVFGPVVDLVADLAATRGELPDEHWKIVHAMVLAVAHRWHEPDHGIWEERHEPRHHVYSKVMCWQTVDRALRLAAMSGREPGPGWDELRAEIAADVLNKGWNADAGAFTAAYGSRDLDAASLYVGLSGLLDADDDRFRATVAAVEAELRVGPTVYRYHRDDGLPGKEGGFHLCTAWLIEAYLLVGRTADAELLFGQLLKTAGPTGLMPEEYDPVAERSLGNHPQAYSHLGLIRCARLLSGSAGAGTGRQL